MQQRWVARWMTPNGTPQEFCFHSENDRMIARIDPMLKLMERDIPRPNEYALEEARPGLPSLPRPVHLEEEQ